MDGQRGAGVPVGQPSGQVTGPGVRAVSWPPPEPQPEAPAEAPPEPQPEAPAEPTPPLVMPPHLPIDYPPPPPDGPAFPPPAAPRPRRIGLVLGWVAAALVVVLTAVAGVVTFQLLGRPMDSAEGGPSSSTTSSASEEEKTAQRDAAVTSALAVMQTAVRKGDEAGFLSTVDPEATLFLDHQRAVFRNLQTLRGTLDISFSWVAGRWFPVPSNRRYATDGIVVAVAVRQQVIGYDPEPFTDVVGMTFSPHNGHWYLESDTDADERLAMGGLAEPWAFGSIMIARHGGALVIGDRSQSAWLGRLAKRLDASLPKVRAMWPSKTWNGRVVAYASTDSGFVQAWFGNRATTGSSDPSGEATFDAKVRVLPGEAVLSYGQDYRPAAPRLVVTPYLLSKDDSYARSVLRHELTHVALAKIGDREIPTWLAEGLAEYTAFRVGSGSAVNGVESLAQRGLSRTTWSQLKSGAWRPHLVAFDDEFYDGTGAQVDNNYTTAWFTCLYIADHYGEQKLRALVQAAATAPDSVLDAGIEPRVLDQVLHTNRAALLTKVRSYARKLRSNFL